MLTGKNHTNWKGGRTTSHGYACLLYKSRTNRYIREHRIIMEKHIGRKLETGEVVHHINEKKDDNRTENLMLLKNDREHKRIHHGWTKKENGTWLKPCSVCGRMLGFDDNFYHRSDGGTVSKCKECCAKIIQKNTKKRGVCIVCKKEFMARDPVKTKHCSGKCAWVTRRKR